MVKRTKPISGVILGTDGFKQGQQSCKAQPSNKPAAKRATSIINERNG